MSRFDELKILPGEVFTPSDWNEGIIGELTALDEYAHRIHLSVDGKVGIREARVGLGTDWPRGPLHILKTGEPPGGLPEPENGLMLGIAGTSDYKWIQSYGGGLSLNPMEITSVLV